MTIYSRMINLLLVLIIFAGLTLNYGCAQQKDNSKKEHIVPWLAFQKELITILCDTTKISCSVAYSVKNTKANDVHALFAYPIWVDGKQHTPFNIIPEKHELLYDDWLLLWHADLKPEVITTSKINFEQTVDDETAKIVLVSEKYQVSHADTLLIDIIIPAIWGNI